MVAEARLPTEALGIEKIQACLVICGALLKRYQNLKVTKSQYLTYFIFLANESIAIALYQK